MKTFSQLPVTQLLALVLLVLASSCVAKRSALFQSVNECVLKHSCISHDYQQGARADSETILRLVFAIKQKNTQLLEKILLDVSDPKSRNYGRHLTFDQIGQMTGQPKAVAAVRHWLAAAGVAASDMAATVNHEFLVANVTVAQAEHLLEAEFFQFSSQSQKDVLRALNYSLPAPIAAHVDFISGVVNFPTARRFGVRTSEAVDAQGSVTPSLLSNYYNVSSNTVASKGATQSLFEISNAPQDFSPADLKKFQNSFNLPEQAVSDIIGSNQAILCLLDPNYCGEANLDVQWIMAIAQGAPTTYWSVKESSSSDDPFLDWILAVANTSNPPLVHSISYGSVEQDNDPSTMNRFSSEVAKLGARGITVMVATGDDGVANYPARSDKSKCGFYPSYPASSPYVTAVGATQGPESGQPEIMCASNTGGVITSGGGFSTVFSQPSYQSKQVSNYLSNGPNLPPTSLFASTGRAYPDVAMLGYNFNVVIGGSTYLESGTSAASPSFAGLVSLVNGLRLAKGKSALGFLNPLLYSVSTNSYHDITSGRNNCCAAQSNPVCCQYGFTATKGWDPTTGLGSANFANFATNLVNAS
jgi:tripeptidyl-peptidase-1